VSFATVFPIVVGLFLAMVACLEAGYRAGRRRMRVDAAAAHEGLGAIEAATFALLGLLLGFAFSGALGRFDARRGMIVQEANAIGTASLRLDFAPEMIDVATIRTAALGTRLPGPIFALLLTVALSTAVTAGYSMSRRGHRSILHIVLYAASIALTIYIVLDLEHPRRGLIRLDDTDQTIEQLRHSIR
jgi:hypothetical protein